MKRSRRNRRLRRLAPKVLAAVAVAAIAAVAFHALGDAGTPDRWRGLAVAPEDRCSPYSRADYRYSQSVEAQIVAAMGGRVYGPYTGRHFPSTQSTDIEHIVALSEAHDSGLCAAGPAVRRRFASDPLNLTLATPEVNRCGAFGKCARDPGQWLPPINRCWFAARIVAVKRRYDLTVDRREADSLERVLTACTSTSMIVTGPDGPTASPRTQPVAASDALRRWDDNRNGRITCREARRHGIAPVPRGHPAYPFMYDRDGDGTVCE